MKTNGQHDEPSRKWLRKMAALEDRSGSVLVGGLAQDLGMLPGRAADRPRVFGRFVEFARRTRGLSVERLAEEAEVDLAELVAIERDSVRQPEPRTIYQLAIVLHVSSGKLLELSGLAEPRDQELDEAALRFAARSEPSAKLSSAEQDAFEEFVKVLVESSDED